MAAQPREGALGLGAEFDVGKGVRGSRFEGRGWSAFFYADLDEFGAGADADIVAARGDEFRLGLRIGGEDFEDGDKVFIREFGGDATEQAAEVAFGDAALPSEITLVHRAMFDATLQGDGKVAHGVKNDEGRMTRVEKSAECGMRNAEWDRKDE